MSQPDGNPPGRAASPAPATIYLRPARRCFIKLYLWAALGLALMLGSVIVPVLPFIQEFMAGGYGQVGAALPANSPWMAHVDVVLATAMMIGGAMLFLGAAGRAAYHYLANLYTITPERVETRHGIIANNTAIVSIIDIRTIDIKQSVTDRLLNIGTLELSTAGTADVYCILKWIHDPERYHQLIYDHRNRSRRREEGE